MAWSAGPMTGMWHGGEERSPHSGRQAARRAGDRGRRGTARLPGARAGRTDAAARRPDRAAHPAARGARARGGARHQPGHRDRRVRPAQGERLRDQQARGRDVDGAAGGRATDQCAHPARGGGRDRPGHRGTRRPGRRAVRRLRGRRRRPGPARDDTGLPPLRSAGVACRDRRAVHRPRTADAARADPGHVGRAAGDGAHAHPAGTARRPDRGGEPVVRQRPDRHKAVGASRRAGAGDGGRLGRGAVRGDAAAVGTPARVSDPGLPEPDGPADAARAAAADHRGRAGDRHLAGRRRDDRGHRARRGHAPAVRVAGGGARRRADRHRRLAQQGALVGSAGELGAGGHAADHGADGAAGHGGHVGVGPRPAGGAAADRPGAADPWTAAAAAARAARPPGRAAAPRVPRLALADAAGRHVPVDRPGPPDRRSADAGRAAARGADRGRVPVRRGPRHVRAPAALALHAARRGRRRGGTPDRRGPRRGPGRRGRGTGAAVLGGLTHHAVTRTAHEEGDHRTAPPRGLKIRLDLSPPGTGPGRAASRAPPATGTALAPRPPPRRGSGRRTSG
ncbi:hypothetical protein SGPA1_21914 [Streptomyces misionensis JCM 4497]